MGIGMFPLPPFSPPTAEPGTKNGSVMAPRVVAHVLVVRGGRYARVPFHENRVSKSWMDSARDDGADLARPLQTG